MSILNLKSNYNNMMERRKSSKKVHAALGDFLREQGYYNIRKVEKYFLSPDYITTYCSIRGEAFLYPINIQCNDYKQKDFINALMAK